MQNAHTHKHIHTYTHSHTLIQSQKFDSLTDKGKRTMLMPTTNKKEKGVTIIQMADLTSKAQAREVGGRTSI